jgi:pseudouridine synthase
MKRVIRFYKPYGVQCKFTDAEGRPTLADYIPIANVYAAGRLDADSEGLVLLTDDTALNHRLTDPRFEHPRTYLVQVEHIPTEEALDKLRRGVEIQEYQTRPAQVGLVTEPPDLPPRNPPIRQRKSIPTAFLKITLTEGKNRQVRRMTAAVGYPTLRLIRIAIGMVTLNGLEEGAWAELSPEEIEDLWRSIKQGRAK